MGCDGRPHLFVNRDNLMRGGVKIENARFFFSQIWILKSSN